MKRLRNVKQLIFHVNNSRPEGALGAASRPGKGGSRRRRGPRSFASDKETQVTTTRMVARAKSPVASALGIALRDMALGASKVLKVGFLAPLTGPLKAWSAPGLDGCQIWVDRVNAGGGIKVGNRRYLIELVSYDTMYQPERAFQGAKKLIQEDGVKLILMNGGNDLSSEVRRLISQHRMLVAILLPSDLSPDTPTIVAPSEVHPIYNVTGVDWLQRNKPHLKTAAMCAQSDLFGLPSIATYRAAFEAAGIELVAERVFDPATTDFGPIVDDLMAAKPNILCWDTAYEPFVHALTIEAHNKGFKPKKPRSAEHDRLPSSRETSIGLAPSLRRRAV